MTDSHSISTGGARKRTWLRWGCLILLATVVAAAILVAVKIFEFTRAADPERQLDLQIEKIKSNLQASAGDGELTDEEIMKFTSRDSDGDPKVRQDDAAIHFDTPVHAVTSNLFGSSGKTSCYTFTITKPLTSSSVVTAKELTSCDSLISDK